MPQQQSQPIPFELTKRAKTALTAAREAELLELVGRIRELETYIGDVNELSKAQSERLLEISFLARRINHADLTHRNATECARVTADAATLERLGEIAERAYLDRTASLAKLFDLCGVSPLSVVGLFPNHTIAP